MKSKEEIIKEDWKGYGSEYSNESGWACAYSVNGLDDFTKETQEIFDFKFSSCDIINYRPKSLQGIEDNNNWISVISENDLPTKTTDCYFIFRGEIETGVYQSGHFTRPKQNELIEYKLVTHYQPITKPKPPIY